MRTNCLLHLGHFAKPKFFPVSPYFFPLASLLHVSRRPITAALPCFPCAEDRWHVSIFYAVLEEFVMLALLYGREAVLGHN